MIDEKDMIGWWLDEFFVKNNIVFHSKTDKKNFKKYYIYHKFHKPKFPIEDKDYRPEFRRIRDFINNRP